MIVTVRHWGKVRVHALIVEGDYEPAEGRTRSHPGCDATFEPTAVWLERAGKRRELDHEALFARHPDLLDDAREQGTQAAAAQRHEQAAWRAECAQEAGR